MKSILLTFALLAPYSGNWSAVSFDDIFPPRVGEPLLSWREGPYLLPSPPELKGYVWTIAKDAKGEWRWYLYREAAK